MMSESFHSIEVRIPVVYIIRTENASSYASMQSRYCLPLFRSRLCHCLLSYTSCIISDNKQGSSSFPLISSFVSSFSLTRSTTTAATSIPTAVPVEQQSGLDVVFVQLLEQTGWVLGGPELPDGARGGE